MKNRNIIKLLIVLFIASIGMSSCKKKEGCYTEEYYRKNNSPEFFSKKKRSKSTLFPKKHRKRMKAKSGR